MINHSKEKITCSSKFIDELLEQNINVRKIRPGDSTATLSKFFKIFLFITKQQKVEFTPVSVTALANAYHRPVASPLPLLS